MDSGIGHHGDTVRGKIKKYSILPQNNTTTSKKTTRPISSKITVE